METSKRLFIISNRLPISISKSKDEIEIQHSSGGLVSAISSYIDYTTEKGKDTFEEKIWVGYPGCTAGVWAQVNKDHNSHYRYLPVFINNHMYDEYYNGMSNSTIWPLFHYFPSYVEYNLNYYNSYIRANSEFLEVLRSQIKESDVIWIHDYHLIPLAGMIRELFPNITIGFFLHIPFPSYELFRMMPTNWQKELLEGLLGADLIGFHTIDYASYFLKSIQTVLGVGNERNIIKYRNRLVKVDVFPISIDFNKFNSAFNYKEIAELRNNYKKQFEGIKIIFSVDRLDYTKGVLSRLKGYELFFKLFPEYIGKVIFILSVIPSRDNIPSYIKRKKEIDEFIGSFNSRIGSITWKPVIYQYGHLDFDNLCALYTASDVALITPLRDGMNLVSKEFVASRMDQQGVLLLSEMAGAARELTDAMMINPNDCEGLARSIRAGLEMSTEEQKERLHVMRERVRHYDVTAWAEDFLLQLNAIKLKQKEFEFMFLGPNERMELVEKFRAAQNRLLLLDYDGTLVPFTSVPSQAKPDQKVLDVLRSLSLDKRNDVYIISGRDSKTLQQWLGHLNVNLIAEHGAKMKRNGKDWTIEMPVNNDDEWKSAIGSVMEQYVKRCANTFIEIKEYSMVWHYRNADPEQARIRSTEIYSELADMAAQLNVQVLHGNKIIEVRVNGTDKGYITRNVLSHSNFDFILACGDDNTDEDMFKALLGYPNAYTLKVGDTATYANYNLYTSQMTISLLELLSHSVHVPQEH